MKKTISLILMVIMFVACGGSPKGEKEGGQEDNYSVPSKNIVERYTGIDGLDFNSSFYRDENGWHKTNQRCKFERINGEIDPDSIQISNLPMHHTVTVDGELLGRVIIVCSMDNTYYRNILKEAGFDDEDLKFDDVLELKICTPGDNAFCSQGEDNETYIQGLEWGDASDPNNIVFQGMQVLIYK